MSDNIFIKKKLREGNIRTRHPSVSSRFGTVADAARLYHSPGQFRPVKRDRIFTGGSPAALLNSITKKESGINLMQRNIVSLPRLRP